jgi:hypothetical protein
MICLAALRYIWLKIKKEKGMFYYCGWSLDAAVVFLPPVMLHANTSQMMMLNSSN